MKKTEKKENPEKTPETRSFKFEFKKAAAPGGEILITGHAAVFNSPSDSGGMAGFMEVIRPGAFNTAIAEDDIRALFNHDPNFVLGRNIAGTLELKEDETGLAVNIKLPATTWAGDLAASMERGDITQMSFSFIPRETKDADGKTTDGDKWNFNTDPVLREILKVKLFDVSIVTYAWYEDTTAEVSTRQAELLKRAQETNEQNTPAAEPAPDFSLLELSQGLKEKIIKLSI